MGALIDRRGISAKLVSYGIMLFSIILIISGGILKFTQTNPTNDAASFLMAIGLICLVYASFRLFKQKDDIYYSKKDITNFLINNVILISMIILMIIISFIEPKFIRFRVLIDILSQSSTRMIIALGIAFTLLIGGTDLSAGRVVGFAAVISASMMQTATYANRFFPDLPQINVLIPIIIAIALSLIFGLLNGFFVAKLGLAPFIATLAVQVIVYGITSLYFSMPPNNSQPIGGIRPDFVSLGQYKVFGKIPILILISAIFIVLVWFVLNKTVFGKNIYAVGGNRDAAKVSGVNVTGTILIVFVIASAFYAVGGVLEAARTAGATNNYGLGYELDAIAACVVGGVSLSGGVGKVRGIVIGVLIFTVITYGLSFIGFSPYWQQIIKGIIIALAVAIDVIKYRSRS